MNKSHWGDLDSISVPPALKSDALPTELGRIAEHGSQLNLKSKCHLHISIYIKKKQKILGRPRFDLGTSHTETRRFTN